MNSSVTPSRKTMFASSGIGEHALRGAVGVAALWCAISISAERPSASAVLAGLSLLAFRGRPICWTMGLVETAWRQLRRPRTDARTDA